MSLQKPEMCKVDGIFWLRNGLNLYHRICTDLPIMVIKDTFFCPELILKTISKTLGKFTENAIIQMFIKISFPVRFKSFSVFLIQ